MAQQQPTNADPDPRSLQGLAADAETDIRKLAQGLAHAGASPQALHGLQLMADTLHKVSATLTGSPHVEDAAKNGPAVDEQGNGGPQGPLASQHPGNQSPDQGPIPGRAPGAVGGPPPNGPFGPAAQQLHQAMQHSAAARK